MKCRVDHVPYKKKRTKKESKKERKTERNKQASKQKANKQTSKRTNKQPNQQTSQQANKQTYKHANKQTNKQTNNKRRNKESKRDTRRAIISRSFEHYSIESRRLALQPPCSFDTGPQLFPCINWKVLVNMRPRGFDHILFCPLQHCWGFVLPVYIDLRWLVLMSLGNCTRVLILWWSYFQLETSIHWFYEQRGSKDPGTTSTSALVQQWPWSNKWHEHVQASLGLQSRWLLASIGFWLFWLPLAFGFWLLLAFGFRWLLAFGFWLLLAFGFRWLFGFCWLYGFHNNHNHNNHN